MIQETPHAVSVEHSGAEVWIVPEIESLPAAGFLLVTLAL
jgi:hypothetical protein